VYVYFSNIPHFLPRSCNGLAAWRTSRYNRRDCTTPAYAEL
jgi:hypothetical protein